MPTEPPKAEPPKRKRRWFQFSLRTLLIFTVVCAIGSAWVTRKVERKRKEREAVDAIIKLGGYALYDYQATKAGILCGPDWLRKLLGENFFSEVEIVSFQGTGDTDAGLENVRGLTQLHRLILTDTNVTDVGLASLKELNQLQTLELWGTNVTDVGLANLKELTLLENLDLSKTGITDAGLANLKGLVKLQRLYLRITNVADAGLVNLRELTQLQTLDLGGTKVSDAGIVNLKGLTQLQGLDLRTAGGRTTKVTSAGLNDLQKALPNCKIYH